LPGGRAASRGRLLVVDDDRLVLATLVQGLEDAGYEVLDADNGDDAILLARRHRPDLALLDIRMDGLSGFDVAAYLREHLHIPFVFLSAFNDAATLAQIQALGALASLVKPLDMGQILPAVASAHARAMALREADPMAAAPPGSAGGVAAAPVEPTPDAGALPAVAASPATAPVDEGAGCLEQVVPLAVGILMHRYSLDRATALARLRQIAARDGRGLAAASAAMVSAIEQLSLAG
jgi:response regulator NasT